MTVFVLIPVFNRISMTKKVIKSLREQILDEPLEIVIIDDGSTDETPEYLKLQSDITVLKGDGSLWWGGSIHLGISYIRSQAGNSDWVVFINNDTIFDKYFVQTLVSAARVNYPAAVGSVLYCENKCLQSIGAKINAWRLRTWDIFAKLDSSFNFHDQNYFEVDVLSGRGVIYSLNSLKKVNGMRPKLVPHYFADYELSVRIKALGYRLLVAMDAKTISLSDLGGKNSAQSFFKKRFYKGSSGYLQAYLIFWWTVSKPIQRISFIPRAIYIFFVAYLKR